MYNYKLGKNSLENRKGIDPRLIAVDDLAITLTTVDYGHGKVAGMRADKVQYGLFIKGKSKCDGFKVRGKHQIAEDGYGKALDYFAYVNGKASWQRDHLAMVACAYFQAASMLGIKIKWGGLWKSSKPKMKNGIAYGWDAPHIELDED